MEMVTMIDFLMKTNQFPSKSAARRAIEGNSIKFNDVKIEHVDAIIAWVDIKENPWREMIEKAGVEFEWDNLKKSEVWLIVENKGTSLKFIWDKFHLIFVKTSDGIIEWDFRVNR
jgi:hypothetical protein